MVSILLLSRVKYPETASFAADGDPGTISAECYFSTMEIWVPEQRFAEFARSFVANRVCLRAFDFNCFSWEPFKTNGSDNLTWIRYWMVLVISISVVKVVFSVYPQFADKLRKVPFYKIAAVGLVQIHRQHKWICFVLYSIQISLNIHSLSLYVHISHTHTYIYI